MPTDADEILQCPVCGSAVTVLPALLKCAQGHRFDAARQGYFNLLTGRGTRFEADTVEMVDARERFLGAGHYGALRDVLADAGQRFAPRAGVLLEAGAGTGYYLRGLADRIPGTPVALDISKFALRRAARRLPEGLNLVWDVWRELPVRSGAADVILNVFAPRNTGEFLRVLSPEGVLLVITPLPGHLAEAGAVIPLLRVPEGKPEDVGASFDGALVEIERTAVEFPMMLSPAALRDVVLMGPAARHLGQDGLSKLPDDSQADRTVRARFTVQVFRRP